MVHPTSSIRTVSDLMSRVLLNFPSTRTIMLSRLASSLSKWNSNFCSRLSHASTWFFSLINIFNCSESLRQKSITLTDFVQLSRVEQAVLKRNGSFCCPDNQRVGRLWKELFVVFPYIHEKRKGKIRVEKCKRWYKQNNSSWCSYIIL